MSVFNPSNAPASPPERRAASDCGCDGSVGFPGSAAYILFDLDGTLTDPKASRAASSTRFRNSAFRPNATR